MGLTMKFSSILWQEIIPVYQEIINHPFNVELAEGTLDSKCFYYYLWQDSYYLISFAKALAFIAGRSDSVAVIEDFLNFSLGALIAERAMHATFLPFSIKNSHFEPSPACLTYTQFLLAASATSSLEEAVAAVLPCFWIYREVGKWISEKACKENHPFLRWIETYSSQEFSKAVDRAIEIFDRLAIQASEKTIERMRKAFMQSSRLEWHFWNDAYLYGK
jgi:thiaminase (transcriptional activator TenA)